MSAADIGFRPRAMVASLSAFERPEIPEKQRAESDTGSGPWSIACANDEERAFLRTMAWECFEDAAGLRRRRAPGPGDTYRDTQRSEQRLLAQFDALLACGSAALAACVARLVESELQDPDAWFVAVLAHGCVAERWAVGEGVRLARLAVERDPAARDAVVESLSLTPHAAVEDEVRKLLRDPSPALRGVALRVLGYRDALTAAEAVPHLDDSEPWVAAGAAEAFRNLPKRDLPVRLIGLLDASSEDVVRAALWTLFRHAHPQAPYKAVQLCRQPGPASADAAWVIALFGSRGDADVLLEALRAPASADVVEAAGWFGELLLTDRLIELLDDGREEIKVAAASALTRLVGGGPRATRSIPADDNPPAASGRRAFYAQPLPPHPVEGPSLERGAWTAWWGEHGKKLNPKPRTRWGRAWSPAEVVAEMENGPGDRTRRERLHFELALCAGDEAPRFRRRDFIPAQARAIEAWSRWVEGRSAALAGTWRV